MLKNKFFVKASILILIFVVITGSIYLYKYNVLKSDQNQIEVLYNIFNEICNEDENIVLTNSTLINFITKKEFKDKDIKTRPLGNAYNFHYFPAKEHSRNFEVG